VKAADKAIGRWLKLGGLLGRGAESLSSPPASEFPASTPGPYVWLWVGRGGTRQIWGPTNYMLGQGRYLPILAGPYSPDSHKTYVGAREVWGVRTFSKGQK
jgi:hypothetical protein